VNGGKSNLARAETALELQRYDLAISEAGLAVGGDPENDHAFHVLARALDGARRHRDALNAIDMAIAKNPTHAMHHVTRSDILRGLIEYDRALEAAEESMRLDPRGLASHYALALCAQMLDQHERAIEVLERALPLAPGFHRTHRFLGDSYLGKKAYVQAEQHYRVALRGAPNDAATLNNLGCALLGRRMKREAALSFKAALLVDPTLSVAKENTHSTVSSLIGRGGAIGVGAGSLFAAKTCGAGAAKLGYLWFVFARLVTHPQALGWVAAVAVAISCAFFGRRKWNERALRQADPQIIAIYEQLAADKRAGRP
jgi:tetratricopeptide (TPR) repeat protein